MSDEAVKRRYDNAGRAARAAANRVAVLRAGQDVLVEKGYGGATMAAIARAAGVSVETVYKGFGSKIELVGQILDHAVAGDDEPVALHRARRLRRGDCRPVAARRSSPRSARRRAGSWSGSAR